MGRGVGKAMARTVMNRNRQESGTTSAIGAGVAGGLLTNATSVNSPILTSCPPEDTSFMCKLNRFFNSLKMIISIVIIFILIIAVIWFGYYWYKSRK
jgi:hypothetical protein